MGGGEWEGESDERCKVETHVPVFYFLSIVGSSARQVSEREREPCNLACVSHIHYRASLCCTLSSNGLLLIYVLSPLLLYSTIQ